MENKEVRPRVKKGLWKPEEDLILKTYIEAHGEGNWAAVSAKSGLMRGGKSCRLRWKNYLRPNIKRGKMSQEEEDLIIRMHKLLGNRWALIAGRLPGRTDNEVKNYWNTHLNKRSLCNKRRATESNTYQNNNDGMEENERTKKPRNSEPSSCKGSPESIITPDEELNENKKESEEINSWIQEVESISNYIGSPKQIANNYAFMFDDDPFFDFLDSFALLESFGCNGEEAYSQDDLQPFMP